jgi:hypothetical protein
LSSSSSAGSNHTISGQVWFPHSWRRFLRKKVTRNIFESSSPAQRQQISSHWHIKLRDQ